MKTPSETVQAAQRLLAERERVGLAKYGTTVDRTDLQAGDWLKHAIEDASDLLLYLIRLQKTMPRACPAGPAPEFIVSPIVCPGTPVEAGEQLDAALGMERDVANDVNELNELCDRLEAEREYLRRWEYAPAKATHLAQGSMGFCWWFYSKPVRVDDNWFCNGVWSNAGENLLGRVACEPRPTPEVDPERAAYLKRWEGAPEWARWLCQNAKHFDSTCWFCSELPILDITHEWRFTGGYAMQAENNILGEVRCEPRPEVQS
jgi:hypothetical protein